MAPAATEFTNYSNGMALTLSPVNARAPCRPRCASRLDRVVDRINVLGRDDASGDESVWLRFGVGHQFFTPDDVTVGTVQADDRPFAGWLFGSLDIVNETVTGALSGRHRHFRNLVGLRLGIVGPSAQGDALQEFWHRVCSCDEPQGWRHQLRDEPGVVFSLGHERKFLHRESAAGFSLDLIGSANGAIGNVYTGAGLGGTLRFGWRVADGWGTTVIDGIGFDGGDPGSRFGLSLFGAVHGRYVARDIFVDGNTWQSSHRVDREPFVVDHVVGLGIHWRRLEIRGAVTRRSRQYTTQAQTVHFGSVAIIWRP